MANDWYLTFDAYEDLFISSVKVYSDIEEDRAIAVTDEFGTVVSEGVYSIPEGESHVNLNLFVPAGTDYALRCNNNNPHLWRDDASDADDLPFPFELGDLGMITGTNVGGDDWNNYYYYFYDWRVESPNCPSDRVEVQAIVVGIDGIDAVTSLNVFPNPTSVDLTISIDLVNKADVNLELIDQLGKIVMSNSLSNLPSGNNNIEFDLKSVEAGVYHLQLTINGQSTSTKVVVK
jgi:hypothetical protein